MEATAAGLSLSLSFSSSAAAMAATAATSAAQAADNFDTRAVSSKKMPQGDLRHFSC